MANDQTRVLNYELNQEGDVSQLVYTFGGVDARASLAPGTFIDTSSLDCLAGKIRSEHDHAREVCDPRYLNPQTGPLYVEGAMPGVVLAVHVASIEPRSTVGYQARDCAAIHFLPLDLMHGTVGLAPALNEARSSLAPGDGGFAAV